MSADRRPALRVGVFVDAHDLPAWEYDVLDRIDRDSRFVLAAVIRNTHDSSEARNWKRVAWNTVDRVEGKLARLRQGSQAFERSDVLHPIAKVTRDAAYLDVRPQVSPSGLVHRFTAEDVERIRALDLDVVMRFGFNILRGDALRVARHGVWSFHHADNRVNRGEPPGYWEVVDGEELTGTILQVLSEDLDNGRVLRRARYATVPGSWSENRRRIYAKSSVLMLDALGELASTGSVTEESDSRPFGAFDRALKRAPSTAGAALNFAATGLGVVRRSLQSRREERWSLLVHRGELRGSSLRKFQEIQAPAGRYWADPFAVTSDGVTQLFFEDFDLRAGRGHIATGRLEKDGLHDVTAIVRPDYHLSYPFVFEHSGALWMIPESFSAGRIEVWRCDEYPHRWSKSHDLMTDVSAVDTTLFHHYDRWWMFTNIDRSGFGDHGDELHLFRADDPLSTEWLPHPRNPISTDAYSARMAGAIIESDGLLLRPAQRGSARYGTGLHFLRIDELSPTSYRETLVETLLPNWDRDIVGVHHCHSSAGLVVMDALRVAR